MATEQPDRLLRTAIRAARAGGELARARRDDPGDLKWKGPRDPQPGALLDIQRRIVEVIKEEFPDDGLLLEGEESGPVPQTGRLWIVDPVSGNWNFNQRIPLFSVGVACRDEGRLEVGAVYDPCSDEMFHGAFGHGAYLNDRPISVHLVADGQDAYERALVGTDLPGDVEGRKRALFLSRSLGNEVTQLWTLGCPALGVCYVAAGRLNAYFALALELWDVAAASVILQEAGGTLSDITGGSWLFSEGGYLASNGVVHGGMLRAVKPALEIYATRHSKRA